MAPPKKTKVKNKKSKVKGVNKYGVKFDKDNPSGSKIIPKEYSILNKIIKGVDKLTGFDRTKNIPGIGIDAGFHEINSKTKKKNMGGVMKARGGTFKGTY
tara:strand:- start:586 stop:885 length:300 start_codon:yes stop_codon:yes gene_type:complete